MAFSPRDAFDALVQFLNGDSGDQLAAMCTADVQVFVPLSGDSPFDNPFASRSLEQLTGFRELLRNAWQDLRVSATDSSGNLEQATDGVRFNWSATGHFVQSLAMVRATGTETWLFGSCTFEMRGERIARIRLGIDFEDLLRRTGGLGSGPGEVRDGFDVLNAAAMVELTDALHGGDVPVSRFESTHVHTSIRYFASEELDVASSHDARTVADLVQVMRRIFESVAIELPSCVSQGRTSTFIGKAIVTISGNRYRYHIRVGLRSSQEKRVAELFFEMYPPAALSEVFV